MILLAVWVLIVFAYLAFLSLEMQLDYNQLLVPCSGEGCNWASITEAEFAALRDWGLPANFYAGVIVWGILVTVIFYAVLGFLIFWRRGKSRIGFILSLLLVVMPISAYADADNVVASYPNLAIPIITISVVGTWLQFIFLYFFPNGRFYPRWAGWLLVVTLAYITISLLTYGGFLQVGIFQAIASDFIFFFLFIGLAVVLQFLRYFRVATPPERLQTRWVLFGFIFYFMGPFLWYIFYGGEVIFQPGSQRLVASMGGWVLLQVTQLTFLLSLVFAIMRYRLWNIDLIIRRTLIYGLLTGLLVLIYFGSVVFLQILARPLIGEQSAVGIVLSTLLIAALFNPLRRRIQAFIDRRFYRQKYDAEQALAEFAAAARSEADLEQLSTLLASTVQETLQPDKVDLWLDKRGTPGKR